VARLSRISKSPNVLSLGRRVAQDGYSWRCEGYTTTPVMIHPPSGEQIRLKVYDLCPYLDDAGSTFPAALCPEASSVARLSSIASASAVRPGGYASCAAHSAAPASSSIDPYLPEASEEGEERVEPTTAVDEVDEGPAVGYAPDCGESLSAGPTAVESLLVDSGVEGDPPTKVEQLKGEASSIHH